MILDKIDHISLSVKDLDESIKWYGEIFGFEKVEEGVAADRKWAIIACKDYMLCMNEYPQKVMTEEKFDIAHQKIYHFGLRINNRKLWEEKIDKLKLHIEYGGAYQYPHSVSWYLIDPTGHEIEISYTEGKALKF